MDERIARLIEESRAPNDSKRNNELVALLREQEASVVFDVLKQLAELRCYNMFEIARKCLNDNEYVRKLYWNGLDMADKSSIAHWLEFALPKLGTKRTLRILAEKENEKPGIIEDALYWLPGLVNDEERDLLKPLRG